MTPDTDIVMGVRGTQDYRTEEVLEKCVDSVETHTTGYHRWIFVDDNSDEVGARFVDNLARKFRDCVLIRTHAQNWFSRAHNKGLRLVRTPYAVVLNSDTVVGQGWLRELYDVKDEVEAKLGKVGMVGSVLNEGMELRWRRTYPPHYVTMHAALLNMQRCFQAAEARKTPGLIFDETSPLTIHIRSDVELSHMLNKIGYETIESYKSAVGHHGGRSWGHLLGTIPSTLDAVRGL